MEISIRDLKTLVHAVRNSCNLQTTKPEMSEEEIEKLCPFLGWCTSEIVKKKMDNTTHLCKLKRRLAMSYHIKNRLLQLNQKRFQVIFSRDTMFATVKLYEGYNAAQVSFLEGSQS